MIKTIQIDNQPIDINTSLGWLFCYREQFGHDILPDLLPLLEAALNGLADIYDEQEEVNLIEKLNDETISQIIVSLSTLEVLTVANILWARCKNAGETKRPEEWLNSFDVFPMDIIVPQLFRSIVESSISSKNSQRLLNKIPILSASTQSQSLAPVAD